MVPILFLLSTGLARWQVVKTALITKSSLKISFWRPILASELYKLWLTMWAGLSNICYSLLYDRILSHVPDKILPSPIFLVVKGGPETHFSGS